MSDGRFRGNPDEEQLPWLAPVERQEEPSGPSPVKLILFVILGLVLLGAVVGGYSWWSQQGATEGHGELIAAPKEPYKIKPTDPGGMEVEGEGDTAFAASEGADPQGRIDMSAVPEDPIVGSGGTSAAKAETGDAASIQLGAFSSEAAANAAWKSLSKRFTYLEPLAYSVIPVEVDEKTLYRLRASGPDAANLCNRLRVAGESCQKVN